MEKLISVSYSFIELSLWAINGWRCALVVMYVYWLAVTSLALPDRASRQDQTLYVEPAEQHVNAFVLTSQYILRYKINQSIIGQQFGSNH